MVERTVRDEPMWDQPEVHDVYRSWRRIIDAYDGDRMAVAEAWTQTPESMARYIRPDELHQAFNFAWLLAPWSAAAFADVVRGTLDAVGLVGAAPTWVLSNHDVVRHVTRYGGGERGLARAKAATLTMLGAAGIGVPLPGRGARARGGRRTTGGAAGPVLVPHRASPDATAPGCRSRGAGLAVAVRVRAGGGPTPWLPMPDDWAPLDGRGAAARPRLDVVVLPSGAASAATARPHRGARGDRRGRSTVLELRRGDLTVLCNCGARDRSGLPRRRGRRWPVARGR